MIYKRRITRIFNGIIAEIYYINEKGVEILVDYKKINNGMFAIIFNLPLKQKHYDEANKWLEHNIILHYKNTKDII